MSKKKSIYIDDITLWDKAVEKSNQPEIDRSLSQIVRRLLEMWLAGEVVPYPEKFMKDGQNAD